LELPAIDKEMLVSLIDNFDRVMAEGPNPKKKHLLHRLAKKVHPYMLPNTRRFADGSIWLPGQDSNLQPSG
jgi:hypothetical protein